MSEVYQKVDDIHSFEIALPRKLFDQIAKVVEQSNFIDSIDDFVQESVKYFMQKKYPAVYQTWADLRFKEYLQKKPRTEEYQITRGDIEKLQAKLGTSINADELMLLHMQKKGRR
jgi:DNA polymerase III sliding clamp (beta) subunit (PCNA family)